jgi:mRNA interferase RelE/StbE
LAQRDSLALNKENRRLIAGAIDELAENPRPDNSIMLRRAHNLRRLTVGDYRVIYGIEESSKTVTVEMVRHRRVVYTYLAALKLAVRGKYSK